MPPFAELAQHRVATDAGPRQAGHGLGSPARADHRQRRLGHHRGLVVLARAVPDHLCDLAGDGLLEAVEGEAQHVLRGVVARRDPKQLGLPAGLLGRRRREAHVEERPARGRELAQQHGAHAQHTLDQPGRVGRRGPREHQARALTAVFQARGEAIVDRDQELDPLLQERAHRELLGDRRAAKARRKPAGELADDGLLGIALGQRREHAVQIGGRGLGASLAQAVRAQADRRQHVVEHDPPLRGGLEHAEGQRPADLRIGHPNRIHGLCASNPSIQQRVLGEEHSITLALEGLVIAVQANEAADRHVDGLGQGLDDGVAHEGVELQDLLAGLGQQ